MDIKVLGTGCANCKRTIQLIEQVAQAKGVPVTLAKVEDIRDIMGYGVMSTPGVVIDGKVVHAGGVPGRDKVEQWLARRGRIMNARVELPPAREVCPTTTRRLLAEGALLVDVRELSEVAQTAFDVPGVVLLPLSELQQRHGELPRDRAAGAGQPGRRAQPEGDLLPDVPGLHAGGPHAGRAGEVGAQGLPDPRRDAARRGHRGVVLRRPGADRGAACDTVVAAPQSGCC